MSNSQILKYLLLLCILLCSISRMQSQCPENEADLVINTQEKHDFFFANYPNCKDYQIMMMNGQYVGDPRPLPYIVSLGLVLAAILSLLKYLLDRSTLK